MTETDWTETDKDAFFAPGMDQSEYDGPPPPDDSTDEYTRLFDAPDYATFVKPDQTPRAKEYEEKVQSMLKGLVLGAFKNGYVADGCTILHYGPGFAKNAGDLTDVSNGAAKAIDMLTAPDNPWVAFILGTIPFALQMMRNHEHEAEVVQQGWREARRTRKEAKARGETPPKREGTPITMRLPFGKKFTVRVHVPRPAVIGNMFRAQTVNPRTLTNQVLSDPKLRRALEKQGIRFQVVRDAER